MTRRGEGKSTIPPLAFKQLGDQSLTINGIVIAGANTAQRV